VGAASRLRFGILESWNRRVEASLFAPAVRDGFVRKESRLPRVQAGLTDSPGQLPTVARESHGVFGLAKLTGLAYHSTYGASAGERGG